MSNESSTKPLTFIYYLARTEDSAEHVLDMRVKLEIFAKEEGYEVDRIFVEAGNLPAGKLRRALESAAPREVKAIIIPDASHLGTDANMQEERRLILEKAGLSAVFLAKEGTA